MSVLAWRIVGASIPETLAHKIEHFKRHGLIVSAADELFANPSWIAVYLGQGIVPERAPVLSELRDDIPVSQRLGQVKVAVEDAADAMPRHDDYLNRVLVT